MQIQEAFKLEVVSVRLVKECAAVFKPYALPPSFSFAPEVPDAWASLPMRHECNGKIAAFLFWTGNTSDDYRLFVRYKTVIPAAFNHKDGHGINGHILSGYCSDTANFMPTSLANAHSERPRSSVATCASQHTGFRYSSLGQASHSSAAHPAKYRF